MTFSNHLFIVFFAAIFRGYQNFEQQKHFYEFAQALADLKFTYVVSCQVYGNQKKSGDPKDQNCYLNIQRLLLTWVTAKIYLALIVTLKRSKTLLASLKY